MGDRQKQLIITQGGGVVLEIGPGMMEAGMRATDPPQQMERASQSSSSSHPVFVSSIEFNTSDELPSIFYLFLILVKIFK